MEMGPDRPPPSAALHPDAFRAAQIAAEADSYGQGVEATVAAAVAARVSALEAIHTPAPYFESLTVPVTPLMSSASEEVFMGYEQAQLSPEPPEPLPSLSVEESEFARLVAGPPGAISPGAVCFAARYGVDGADTVPKVTASLSFVTHVRDFAGVRVQLHGPR